MHLIIDIRSSVPVDPFPIRYARNWVDLWLTRHPNDTISYLHYIHQDCPENGKSIIIHPPGLLGGHKRLASPDIKEAFRCVSFSELPIYDYRIPTLLHRSHNHHILYTQAEKTILEKLHATWLTRKHKYSTTLIVPSRAVEKEELEIRHTPEYSIEIIPYIDMSPGKGEKHTLLRHNIHTEYWIYDGSYGKESNIDTLLQIYAKVKKEHTIPSLLLLGKISNTEILRIARIIETLHLGQEVKILGLLENEDMESFYMHAAGWISVESYYTSGARIELARSHHLPLLIPRLETLSEYLGSALTYHPNHHNDIEALIIELSNIKKIEFSHKQQTRTDINQDIMERYEKILARSI